MFPSRSATAMQVRSRGRARARAVGRTIGRPGGRVAWFSVGRAGGRLCVHASGRLGGPAGGRRSVGPPQTMRSPAPVRPPEHTAAWWAALAARRAHGQASCRRGRRARRSVLSAGDPRAALAAALRRVRPSLAGVASAGTAPDALEPPPRSEKCDAAPGCAGACVPVAYLSADSVRATLGRGCDPDEDPPCGLFGTWGVRPQVNPYRP